MPKTVDVPVELREFNRIFETMAYRFGWSEVFTDFLDYSVACFLDTGDVIVAERLQKKYQNHYNNFRELFKAWIMAQGTMVKHEKDWYDGLGAFYEVISSSGKASALGQFFTPAPLVDMLVELNQCEIGAGKRMLEPACGSGRMAIAFHAHYPGNYIYASDIDWICTKMTALNMVIHGCEGQVVCMDALHPDDWRFGYVVNPWIRSVGGVPHLVRIEKEQCKQWRHWQHEKAIIQAIKQAETERKKEEQKTPIVREEPRVGKHGQLSFF